MAILHHLRDHPTAKDSAAGIAKWWVGEERDTVEKALARLVEAGVMEKRRHVYQLVPPAAAGRTKRKNTARRVRRKK